MIRRRRRRVHIHDGVRAIYLAHPRTASVATGTALERRGFDEIAGGHLTLEAARQASNVRVPDSLDSWTVFTTVRNHWDTVVSWLHLGSSEEPVTREAIRDLVDRRREIEPGRLFGLHLDAADVVLRYEHLQKGLDRLLDSLGLEPVEIPREHVSVTRPDAPYRELYDSETRSLVRELFGGEIERLDYDFGGPRGRPQNGFQGTDHLEPVEA